MPAPHIASVSQYSTHCGTPDREKRHVLPPKPIGTRSNIPEYCIKKSCTLPDNNIRSHHRIRCTEVGSCELQNGTAQIPENVDNRPWYAGVTRYEWLVLIIASAGWIFDQYESQVFVLTKDRILAEVSDAGSEILKGAGDPLYAIFLLGGTLGGLVAGSLADRYGRRPLLVATIVPIITPRFPATFFVTSWWQLATLRFLVAIGVGGEWAVAASLVAEVFPARARAYASGIFHASSIIGIWMATVAAIAVGETLGAAAVPGRHRPVAARRLGPRPRQRTREMASNGRRRRAIENRTSPNGQLPRSAHNITLNAKRALAWGRACRRRPRHLLGRDCRRPGPYGKAMLIRTGASDIEWKTHFAYGFVQTTGGGLGLLAFGPLSARFGRRRTFIAFQLLALIIVPITCFAPQTYGQLLVLLPIFAFLTLAIHAGFAIYFPELFPTHLRATGASFCFNGGRVMAVPVLLISSWLKSQPGIDLRWSMTLLSTLFLVGIVLMLFLPETNKQELPE